MELTFLGSNEQTMTSREIAELTGKNHAHVMRDIKNITQQLDNQSQTKFGLSEYVDSTGRTLPMYQLTKKETLLLISGYNVNLRLAIINRWEELEKKLLPTTYKDAILALGESLVREEQLQLKANTLEVKLDVLLDWVSIIKIAKHNKVKETAFNWRVLKSESKKLGYEIKKSESPRFGYQNLYHINCFKSAYPEFNYNIK